MKKIWLLLLMVTPSVFAQSLNWPQQGYLEDWGFQRPTGCQPGDGYILPWARKFEQVYGANPTTANAASSRQYLQGGGSYAFIQAIRSKGLQSGEGRALSQLIQQLQEQESEHLRIARDYLSLRAGGGNSSSVVNAVRRFEISDNSCFGGKGGSASGALLCGLAAKIADHTIKLENAVQFACHAGLPTPKGGGSLATAPVGASADSSGNITSERWQAVQANQQPAQEQTKQAQQQSQQSQQLAQQNQSRADQERQGKRKTHDPAAEAHECISIDKAGSGNFGAFKNQCPYPVNFTTCNEKPRIIQGGFNWSADFDCAKQQFGLHTPKGNSSVAAHNRSTEFVYWFACKAPAMPVDATYVAGKGIEARCHN